MNVNTEKAIVEKDAAYLDRMGYRINAARMLALMAERDTFAAANARLERERDEARFAPMGDNHHNAVACPYCNPELQSRNKRFCDGVTERDAALSALAKAEGERDREVLLRAEAVVAVNNFDRERMAEARLRYSMEKERDAAIRERDEMRSTAAGVTLSMTKQRDAALSALAKAEGERDLYRRSVLAKCVLVARKLAQEGRDPFAIVDVLTQLQGLPDLAALTPAPEAPEINRASFLGTEAHYSPIAPEGPKDDE